MPNDTNNEDDSFDKDMRHDEAESLSTNKESTDQSSDVPEVNTKTSSVSNPVPPQPTQTRRVEQSVLQESLKPTPGLLVLQWLTYAFWGWTLFSLAILISMVMSTLFSTDDGGSSSSRVGSGTAYVLAAVIVLFVISLVTDIFYSKAEKGRTHSTGSNVIMIIHAVLFALIGIGSLIMAVFGGVQLLVGETDDTNSSLAIMSSGLIITVLYGLLLLRVLRPRWAKGIEKTYWGIMTVVVVVAVVMGVVGPAMQARLQKQDQVTESGVRDVARAVGVYASRNDKLPASLKDLTNLDTEAKKLVDDGDIKYTPKEKMDSSSTSMLNSGSSSALRQSSLRRTAYHYELCVEYKTKDTYRSYTDDYTSSTQSYPTTPRTYGHKAGNVCYDLQTRTSTSY